MLISPAEQPWLPVMDHLFGDEQLGVGWRGSWGWGGRGAYVFLRLVYVFVLYVFQVFMNRHFLYNCSEPILDVKIAFCQVCVPYRLKGTVLIPFHSAPH